MTEMLDVTVLPHIDSPRERGKESVRVQTRQDDAMVVTVVVPTKNEAANIAPLVAALHEALQGRRAEVIFVDDSDDDTAAVVRSTADGVAASGDAGSLDVRLIERVGAQRVGGLSGAVLAGLRMAKSRWVCVMDGDMQHPPTVIAEMLALAETGEVDLVVASRFRPTASSSGLSRRSRKLVSSACGGVARRSFARRLADITDPMSGFFLVDTDHVEFDHLRPRGFKILLELMVSHPNLRVAEVPFTFGPRHAGASKANAAQGLEFARQVAALKLSGARRGPWNYDVHGIVTVRSDRALPELEKFRVRSLADTPTITVTVRADDTIPLGESVDVTGDTPKVSYRERTGFSMSLDVSDAGVAVRVSPFVAKSPHVMYTNVVEPILRWQLVQRGYALVHAACFADEQEGFLVTARTDTGKTTTMLKVLDNSPLRFVSDDLVIVSPDGVIRSFPKPLTISAHTVHALKDTDLNRFERTILVPQSRIHSREGRQLAFLLTKYRLPVASINAIIQRVVPPPKYHVERLVRGVRSATGVEIAGMFIIQRGGTGDEALPPEEALTTLLSNCDDAFGFPPYASLERLLLAIADDDLRVREREIIATALTDVQVRLMRSDTLDWAVRIPHVVASWRSDNANSLEPDVVETASSPS
jgi:glycosyltransferase involved in cell wall biosynthesis